MVWRFTETNKHYVSAVSALEAGEYPAEFLGPSLDELKTKHPDILGAALKQAAETLQIGARWGAGGDLRHRDFEVTAGLTLPQRKAQLKAETIRLAGKHPAGTRLPTTANLGRAYGFSDGTVKNVFSALVADGVLVSGGGSIYLAHPADPAREQQMAAAAEKAAEQGQPSPRSYVNPRLTAEALREVIGAFQVGGTLPRTGVLRTRLETLLDLAPGKLEDAAITQARAQLVNEGLLERGGATNAPRWRVKAKIAEATQPALPTSEGGPAPALAAVVRLLDDAAHRGISMYDAAAMVGHSDNIVLQALAVRQLRDDMEGLVLETGVQPGDVTTERLKAYSVAEHLIQRMRSGDLDPDGIFPTQAELAKTLGVGPAPAKVALITIGLELGCGAQYRSDYEATLDEISEIAGTLGEVGDDDRSPRQFFRDLAQRVTEEFPKGTKLPGVREMAERLKIPKIAIEKAIADLKAGDHPLLVTLKGGERGGLFTAVGEPSEAAEIFAQSAAIDLAATQRILAGGQVPQPTIFGTGQLSPGFGTTVLPPPGSLKVPRQTAKR